MEPTSTKSILLYNARDLHQTFAQLYEQKFQQKYQVKSFIGYEMKLLKGLLETHDVFAILCGIVACIKRNANTVSIPYFVAGIKFYVPDDDNPELRWKVQNSNQPEYRTKWQELRLLKAKWLPKATDRTKMIQLEKDLMGWLDEKNKKTALTSKSKKESQ